MSSQPALVAWQQKYATDIVERASDLKLARQKLDLGVVHLGRAEELLRRNEYDLALNSAENALRGRAAESDSHRKERRAVRSTRRRAFGVSGAGDRARRPGFDRSREGRPVSRT